MLIYDIWADEIIQHDALLHGLTFPSNLTLVTFVSRIVSVTVRGSYLFNPENNKINNFMTFMETINICISQVSAFYK